MLNESVKTHMHLLEVCGPFAFVEVIYKFRGLIFLYNDSL